MFLCRSAETIANKTAAPCTAICCSRMPRADTSHYTTLQNCRAGQHLAFLITVDQSSPFRRLPHCSFWGGTLTYFTIMKNTFLALASASPRACAVNPQTSLLSWPILKGPRKASASHTTICTMLISYVITCAAEFSSSASQNWRCCATARPSLQEGIATIALAAPQQLPPLSQGVGDPVLRCRRRVKADNMVR